MYVLPYVEQRLQELAIGAGEPLLLCKRRIKEADRNRTEWSVKRAPQQTNAASMETAAAAPLLFPEDAEDHDADHGTRKGFDGEDGACKTKSSRAATRLLRRCSNQLRPLADTQHRIARNDAGPKLFWRLRRPRPPLQPPPSRASICRR
jgi:hypothetical protein